VIPINQEKLWCVGEKVKDVVIKLPLKSLKMASEKYPEFEPLKSAYNSLKEGIGGELPVKILPPYFMDTLKRIPGTEITIITGGNAANEYEVGRLNSKHVGFKGWVVALEEGMSLIIQPKEVGERFILNVGEARRITKNIEFLENLSESTDESVEVIVPVGWHVLFYDKDWDYLPRVKKVLEKMKEKVLTVTDTGGFNVFTKEEIKGLVETIYFQVSVLSEEKVLTVTDTGGFNVFTKEEIKGLVETIYFQVNVLSSNEYELVDLAKTIDFSSDNVEDMIKKIMVNSEIQTFFYHEAGRQIAATKQKFSPEKLVESMTFSAAAGCVRVEIAKPPPPDLILKKIRDGKRTDYPFIRKKENDLTIVQIPCFIADQVKSSVGAGDVSIMSLLVRLLDL